ncbi:MAG: hypothetical protein RR825_07655, partial [Ruthenibacterium sp.]
EEKQQSSAADKISETRFDTDAKVQSADLPLRVRDYQPDGQENPDINFDTGGDFTDAPLYLDDVPSYLDGAPRPFPDTQMNKMTAPASGAVFLPEIPDAFAPNAQRTSVVTPNAQRAAASPRAPQAYCAQAQRPSAAVPAMAHTPQHAANAPHARSTNKKTKQRMRADASATPQKAAAAPHAAPKSAKPPKKKKKHRILKKLIGLCACLLLVCGGGVAVYLNIATRNDFLWLDLAQL